MQRNKIKGTGEGATQGKGRVRLVMSFIQSVMKWILFVGETKSYGCLCITYVFTYVQDIRYNLLSITII